VIRLPRSVRDAIVAHAFAEAPLECCGLLVGAAGAVSAAILLDNEARSPTRFRASPESLFRALKQCRAEDWDVIAIYHSHPTSAAVPSLIDIAEHHWPGTWSVIISLSGPEPDVQAWWIEHGEARPVMLKWSDS
jgi:[CysO sulfur-carrier protein]-S-L-cysteine hydrolase